MKERRVLGCFSPKTGIALLATCSLCSNAYLYLCTARREDADPSLQAALASFARGFAVLSSASALSGLYGVLHEHLPSLRFFCLAQLAEVSLYAIGLISFGLLAMSGFREPLGHAICGVITSAGQDEVHEWTLNLLDGWDNCVERWLVVGLAVFLLSSLMLLLRALLLAETFHFYRFACRRQSLIGKPLAPVDAPAYSVKRVRSYSHNQGRRNSGDRLLLLSPFVAQPSSVPSSPTSASGRSPKPRSRTFDSCSRRTGHAPQHSDAQVLVYAPLLMTLEEADSFQLPTFTSSPVEPPDTTDRTAFPLFKGESSGTPIPSDKQC